MSKILIVDDNKVDQKIIENILINSYEDYDIRIVDSGKLALEEMEKNPADLVILDIVMPDIDGVETYNNLIILNHNKYLPIIFVSAYLRPTVQLKGLRLGVWDYLPKPIKPEELQAKVVGALKIKKLFDNMQIVVDQANEKIKDLYCDLRQKDAEFRQLDLLKDDLIATVSHELKTPLSTIKDFTSILLEEPPKLTDDQSEYIGIINSNIDRLSRLVENILDNKRIKPEKMKLKREFVNIIHLAQYVVSMLKPTADKMNITLKTTYSKSRINVYLDSDRVVQVFMNLLSNALKFTQQNGHVSISIEEKQSQIECSVTDTGVGIAPENLDKLFLKFRRFGPKAETGHRGVGLGLAIAKEIVDMHNGKIWVESKVKKGAKFIFTLPKRTTCEEMEIVAVSERGALNNG